MATKVTVGKTVKDAKAAAIELAGAVYANAKIDNAAGQTFKNELIFALLNTSGRCRRAAEQVLGTGKARPVIKEKSCCQ